MQDIIIAFFTGFAICAVNGAVIAYILYKRIKDLEKFLFIKNDLQTYSLYNQQKTTVNDTIGEENELVKQFRRTILQNTVSDDDIKMFGEKEPINA